jgi:hypothetical protein
MRAASAHRKRRRISPDTWASIAAAISRQHATLKEDRPDSPRISPSLARVAWLERDPPLTNIVEAANGLR